MTTFTPGTRVIFRENTDGPDELGTVGRELEPTETHPNGGEFLVTLDRKIDGSDSVVAWVDELTAVQ